MPAYAGSAAPRAIALTTSSVPAAAKTRTSTTKPGANANGHGDANRAQRWRPGVRSAHSNSPAVCCSVSPSLSLARAAGRHAQECPRRRSKKPRMQFRVCNCPCAGVLADSGEATDLQAASDLCIQSRSVAHSALVCGSCIQHRPDLALATSGEWIQCFRSFQRGIRDVDARQF